jgi:hypothetical protein
MRSLTVGIPRGRRLPSAFGMYRLSTGGARYVPARSSSRSSFSSFATPYSSTALSVTSSTPAAPLLRFTRSHASSRTSLLKIRSYSAWKRRSFCAWLLRRASTGVVGLSRPALAGRGCWKRFRASCPHPYLQLKHPLTRGPSLQPRSSSRPSPVLRPPRTPAALRPLSHSAYAVGLCRTSAAQTGLSCSALLLQRVLLPLPRRASLPIRTREERAWPSPRHARLGARVVSLTRRQASLDVAARVVAPLARLSSLRAFDTALHQSASRPQVAVCYRALRRLPGRDFHPLDQCSVAPPLQSLALPLALSLHDAPWVAA